MTDEKRCCACGGTDRIDFDDGTWACANQHCRQYDPWNPTRTLLDLLAAPTPEPPSE